MPELSVNRTLAKPPPEVWPEVSEVERLANHLGELGEISISRLEPERTVAWESEHARGTVELEASGWGTKVTLKAQVREMGAAEAPAPLAPSTIHQVIPDLEAWDRSAAEIESHAGWQTAAAQRAAEREALRAQRKGRRGRSRRFSRGRRADPEAVPVAPSPLPAPAPCPPAAPVHGGAHEGATQAAEEERALAVLQTALDKLGAAPHKPASPT